MSSLCTRLSANRLSAFKELLLLSRPTSSTQASLVTKNLMLSANGSAGSVASLKEPQIIISAPANHSGVDLNSHRNASSTTSSSVEQDQYKLAIKDLNSLQSNADALHVARANNPDERFELLKKHLHLAGIRVDDLRRLNIIHISGTKGKGSTCAFVESILRSYGYTTGFYNSPHLIKVPERIRINGEPVSSEKFCHYFRPLFDRLKASTSALGLPMPAYFAFLTILAFRVFLDEAVQVAIVEVGVGGEYDTTNVINQPIACGITSLDYDHTHILGETIEQIAWNKAGIIKNNCPVFTVSQCEPAIQVIRERAAEKCSPLIVCPTLKDRGLDTIDLGIDGPVQQTNASLAIQLAEHWIKSLGYHHNAESSMPFEQNEATTRGLKHCRWAGRCQIVKKDNLVFFLDGAHTKDSMRYCRDWFVSKSELNNSDDERKISRYLMMNIIGHRSREQLMEILSDLPWTMAIFSTNKSDLTETNTSDNSIGVSSSNEKNYSHAKQNADIWRRVAPPGARVLETRYVKEAIDLVRKNSAEPHSLDVLEHHVLVTGSLHLVGTVLGLIGGIPK